MNEIILRERVITIPAGDTFDQALQGNVLRVTSGNVPLRVQNRNGGFDFTLNAGERAQFDDDNEGLILSHNSGVAQTFTIQVGKGVNVASALVSGTVTITGTPNVNVTGGTLTGIADKVKTVDTGQEYVLSWKDNTLANAATYQTVFTPAENVNGVLLHDLRFMTNNATFTPMYNMFIAKAGIPASAIDGEVILSGDTAVSGVVSGKITSPLKIKAGMGLYFFASTTEQSHSMKMALYTKL